MDDKKRRDDQKEEAESESNSVEEINQDATSNVATEDSIVIKKEFDALKDLASKLEDQYKRAIADYQNLQRRTQDEKREWARLSNKDIILKFLPILDTLMLAEKHTKDQNFVLTVQQFLSALEQEGVTKIKTVGEEFNPRTMEAVSTTEGNKGEVVEELRAGYLLYDTVLRPAQVVVGS